MTFLLLCQRLQVNNFLLFVAEVVITSFVSSQELHFDLWQTTSSKCNVICFELKTWKQK